MLRLSVLDQSTVVTGRSPDTSIRESLALAKHCEALGYTRYWCAEHHNSASQAGTAPEILISAIAATTNAHPRRLRRGHAAALLQPEGGRAVPRAGGDRTGADRPRSGPRARLGRTHRLSRSIRWRRPRRITFRRRCATCWRGSPARGWSRAIRSATSSPSRADRPCPRCGCSAVRTMAPQVAAYFGLPFCFAHFITDGRGVEQAMALYRENYRPSERIPTPYGALCVWAMAAETEAEAARLFSSREMWRLGRDRGVFAALPSPEEAAAYAYTDAEMHAHRTPAFPRALRHARGGGGRSCARWQRTHGVEEIAILTTLHDPEARRRSYTLLAQEFGLTAQIPLAAD